MRPIKSMAALALAAIVGSGCLELEVLNPNAADAERALRTASDIEALVAGGYGTWWNPSSSNAGPSAVLATAANMHSGTAANYGMVEFSSWPRVAAHNQPAQTYSGNVSEYGWTQLFRAISSVTEGLRALDGGEVSLPAAEQARAQAYGYFVLGMAHGSVALLYDQGYIYDPSISLEDVELHSYSAVMEAALGYFDRAIQEAQGQSFTVPATWMSREVSAQELIRYAHSMKARYRANVARTPTEREAVNWGAVIADVDNGLTSTWTINVTSGTGFASTIMSNLVRYGSWGQMSYQVFGMADQSGLYQRWIEKDPWDRHPNLAEDQVGDPFIMDTPDQRFPSGATVAEQQANRGRIFEVATAGGGFAAAWTNPGRGQFRWSYYRIYIHDQWQGTAANRTTHPEVTMAEMQLLKAEGLYRTGDAGGAAALINVTRTAAGLNATDAAGLNSSCVPRLRDGSCGDLFEMLKWEKRLETLFTGPHMAAGYFDGRGWGDLAQGTFLEIPVPTRELDLLALPHYTTGGPGGESSAPVGNYGY